MFRIGIVTEVNSGKKKARVKFPESGLVSDWLPVVNHSSMVQLSLKSDGKDWNISGRYAGSLPDSQQGGTVAVTVHPDTITGSSPVISCSCGCTHSHEITLQIHQWLPFNGQAVVCLYNGEFNGDGIIIGGTT